MPELHKILQTNLQRKYLPVLRHSGIAEQQAVRQHAYFGVLYFSFWSRYIFFQIFSGVPDLKTILTGQFLLPFYLSLFSGNPKTVFKQIRFRGLFVFAASELLLLLLLRTKNCFPPYESEAGSVRIHPDYSGTDEFATGSCLPYGFPRCS